LSAGKEILNNHRRGSILILSLWALFFLAALALAIGSYVSANIMQAERLADRLVSSALAKAGAERSAMVALSNTNEWDGLSPEAWNNMPGEFGDIELEGGRFSVVYVTEKQEGHFETNFGIIGEEGRVDLNEADTNVLTALIRKIDGDNSQIATAILDWRPDDQMLTGGAGSNYYFQSVEELLLVEGIDTELFDKLSRYVTVYGSRIVNINAADKVVLESLALGTGADESIADDIVDFREAGNSFKELGAAAIKNALYEFSGKQRAWGNMMPSLTIRSSSFRGTALGWLPGREKPDCGVDFVCDTDSGEFVYWREN